MPIQHDAEWTAVGRQQAGRRGGAVFPEECFPSYDGRVQGENRYPDVRTVGTF